MPTEFKLFTKSKRLVNGRAGVTVSAFIPVFCIFPPHNIFFKTFPYSFLNISIKFAHDFLRVPIWHFSFSLGLLGLLLTCRTKGVCLELAAVDSILIIVITCPQRHTNLSGLLHSSWSLESQTGDTHWLRRENVIYWVIMYLASESGAFSMKNATIFAVRGCSHLHQKLLGHQEETIIYSQVVITLFFT